MGNCHKNIQLMLAFLKGSFLVLQFSYYNFNDLPDDVIYNIAIYADDTTLYFKCDQASDLWQQLELASELNLTYETINRGRNGLSISMLEKLN